MKIILNRWQWLYLQLLVMMIVMMAVSFLPEYLHEFFGDWKCEGSGEKVFEKAGETYPFHYEKCNYGSSDMHPPTWHWGWRHWILIIFGITFCIVNVIRIIENWERRPQ